MRTRNKLSICAAFAALFALTASPSSGQELTGSPSAPEYKYSTSLPPGIASPDTVDTRLGTLTFFDGFPDKATVEKLYDNLDFQRVVQAYLLALPAVNQAGNRDAILQIGPASHWVPALLRKHPLRISVLVTRL